MKMNFKNAVDFESSKADLLERSQKRAWMVAIGAVVTVIIMAIAIMLLTPLKTVEPYLVKVDKSTGVVEIMTILNEKEIGDVEALDKFFVTQYVKQREGYYYDLLESDYVNVQLMSNPRVAAEYRNLYVGNNSKVSLLEDKKEIEVKILSVVLGESAGTKMATARAELITKDLSSKLRESVKTIVITLSYEYVPKAKQSEEERLINPLGFLVTSYRIDNEVN